MLIMSVRAGSLAFFQIDFGAVVTLFLFRFSFHGLSV